MIVMLTPIKPLLTGQVMRRSWRIITMAYKVIKRALLCILFVASLVLIVAYLTSTDAGEPPSLINQYLADKGWVYTVWAFIQHEAATAGLIGVIGFIFTVRDLFKEDKKPDKTPATVEHTPYDRLIIEISQQTGVPEAVLCESYHGYVARKPKQVDLNEEMMRSILTAKASEYQEFRKGWNFERPQRQALADKATAALDSGDLALAEDLLKQLFDLEKSDLAQNKAADRKIRLSAANVAAKMALTASFRFDYLAAAIHYAEAVDLCRPVDESQAEIYLRAQGKLLFKHGDEFGDNEALKEAIKIYQELIGHIDRAKNADSWADLTNSLGNALVRLGERENTTEHLEEAVAAYHESLKEYTRERAPLDWAGTQNNLGNALSSLGERESGPERLEEAVGAYREALKEYTRERVPLDWASTQNNLGSALISLGECEDSSVHLEEAVAVFEEALKEYTRERAPLKWAMVKNNLGTALKILGERESSVDRLEKAVFAFQEALKEYTRDNVPLKWAAAQRNLGDSLVSLGEYEKSPERLEEAMGVYREVLKVYDKNSQPQDWAEIQNHLGVAFMSLSRIENTPKHLEEAVKCFQEALDVGEPLGHTYYWQGFGYNLNRAKALLAERLASAGKA